MQRPINDPFDRPPALGTRSSTSDVYISPELRSTSTPIRPSIRPSLSISSPVIIRAPSPSTLRPPAPRLETPSVPFVLQEPDVMQQPQQPAPPSNVVPSASASATPSTTAAATGGAPTTVIVSGGADSAFAPPPFRGIETDDAELWMSRFEKYVAYRQLPVQEQLNLFAVLLRDEASDWFDNLETAVRAAWPTLKEAFEQRFQDSELLRWRKANDLWQRVQGAEESVDTYITAVKKLAKAIGVQGEQLRYAIQRGLRPQILSHVIQSQPTTVDDVVKAARVAEAAFRATAPTSTEAPMDRVVAELAANRLAAEQNTLELRKFTNQLSKKTVDQVTRSPSPQRSGGSRRVTFAGIPGNAGSPTFGRPQQQRQQRGRGRGFPDGRSPPATVINCNYCGGKHRPGKQFCRAAEVECFLCKKVGHLAKVCRSARRQQGGGFGFGYNPGGGPNFSA